MAVYLSQWGIISLTPLVNVIIPFMVIGILVACFSIDLRVSPVTDLNISNTRFIL
jgi:hypothetical protein